MKEDIFAASIDSIIITDIEGIITRANPAAKSMLGYKRNELIGRPVSQLYAIEPEFEKVIKALETKGKFKGEIINKTKTGLEINCFLSANCIYDENGDISGTMGISRNITSNTIVRKEYEQLVNTISDIIFEVDAKGYFIYVNKSVKKILGYSPKKLIGTRYSDLVNKQHLALVSMQYKSHLENKRTQSYLEFQIIKKDGTLIWVGQQASTKYNLIHKDKIDGIYGVVRDIDAHKRTELLLAQSEDDYSELLETSSDLILSIDLKGNFLYVNNAWNRTMGYSKAELRKLNLFSIVHPGNRKQFSSLIKNVIKSGRTSDEGKIHQLVAKNGRTIYVEGIFSVKLENDRPISVQSFLRNVTNQKVTEKQLMQREKILFQITETLSDVFYFYNIKDKKYEYISSNCITILGASDEFFYAGKKHAKIFGHPEDQDKLKEANLNVDKGIPYDIDYRIIINGKTKWINEKSFPIRGDNEKVIANSGILRDITELKGAHEIIYNQNIEIGASILYAKRLQESVLPNQKKIREIFPDSFIMYKPKDIVSGDFYVVDLLKTNESEVMPTFIVGDCTGHGVPGAVLSLMCNVLIRESFTRQEVNTPSEALDFVRSRLINFFKSKRNGRIRDGMDVAFCVFNKSKNQLYFSGAYNSCVVVSGKSLKEYKGDRQHVGYTDKPSPYTNHIIDVKKGDMVFLYTDGYVDQFGGHGDKKYTKRKLHLLFRNAYYLTMEEFGKFLESSFIEWKGKFEQIDDVTVLGIRVE